MVIHVLNNHAYMHTKVSILKKSYPMRHVVNYLLHYSYYLHPDLLTLGRREKTLAKCNVISNFFLYRIWKYIIVITWELINHFL